MSPNRCALLVAAALLIGLDSVGADAGAHPVRPVEVRSTLTAATDAVTKARNLDPLYRLALTSATRSYCRFT